MTMTVAEIVTAVSDLALSVVGAAVLATIILAGVVVAAAVGLIKRFTRRAV